jgi:hypothetical protein
MRRQIFLQGLGSALRFATDEELRVFERSISSFFWTQDFAGAEQVLQDALRDHPSSFSDICQTISPEAVSISGWDELYAQIEVLARNGSRCTAIEIDLSGHADREMEPGGPWSRGSNAPTTTIRLFASRQQAARRFCPSVKPAP